MIQIRLKLIALAATSLLLTGTAMAGDLHYTCKITQVYHLKEIGTLETAPESITDKDVKQDSFTISRETGAITGKTSELDTKSAQSTVVIHRGSEDSSFVAVADFGLSKSGTHAYRVIKVEEYRKGSEKPFVAMGDLTIVSGTCK
jgi:hypothetical protein